MNGREQATFDAAELAVVLSYYDLGIIESITDFVRGSRRSPKVGLVSERGKFLLKRRAAERAHPERVRFAHQVQRHLVRAGFPLARLVATRDDGRTILPLREHIYELFEFMPGQTFDKSPEETSDAGRCLAKFHQLTRDFPAVPGAQVPHGDYHDAMGVRSALGAIGSSLKSHDSFTGDEAELADLLQYLLDTYDRCAEAVNRRGFGRWPEQVIHADWHPGNLLFRQHKVLAVVDFDAVRYSRRVADVANGALQFSMVAGGDPATWPDHLDEGRFAAFVGGYTGVEALSDEERACVAPLMMEALIAECVGPIAATGSVGRWSGFRMLKMARRKVNWIAEKEESLAAAGR